MKGKIISFSPHRRRGMIMVYVKGEEGMEYKHLQFDSNHYDGSIESHLYKDQTVDVSLIKLRPGSYKVEKIFYDIGKNLYKRTRPERLSSEQDHRPRRSDDYKGGGKFGDRNQRSSQYSGQRSDQRSSQRSGQRSDQRSSQRTDQRESFKNKPLKDNKTILTSGKQSSYQNKQNSKNKNHSHGDKRRPQRSSGKLDSKGEKRFKPNYKKSDKFPKSKRGYNRRFIRERLRYLAFFLYYRRVKLQKMEKLKKFKRKRILVYKRRMRLISKG